MGFVLNKIYIYFSIKCFDHIFKSTNPTKLAIATPFISNLFFTWPKDKQISGALGNPHPHFKLIDALSSLGSTLLFSSPGTYKKDLKNGLKRSRQINNNLKMVKFNFCLGNYQI